MKCWIWWYETRLSLHWCKCIWIEGWPFTHTPPTLRWSATAGGWLHHSIHFSLHSVETQQNQMTGPCLPTFSDESAAGLALLAEEAAKKADTTKTQLPPSLGLMPRQIRPYDPAAKLPSKLVLRIENLEFIEVAEMLPETWASVTLVAQDLAMPLRPITQGPVTDIVVWLECFSLLAGVLVKKYPDKTPEVFAYQKRIVHASCNLEGVTWVAYDRAYRCQALSSHSLDWSIEDPALYNEAFVGHAMLIPQCKHCLSEHQSAQACSLMAQFVSPWGVAGFHLFNCRLCPLFSQSKGPTPPHPSRRCVEEI